LDFAFELWEDDGSYGEAAAAIATLGLALGSASKLGGNPYVLAAGVTLGVIAGLVGLAGLLREDTRYGQEQMAWVSDTDLATGVGPRTVSLINSDTGWRDLTQWNYRVQIDLVATGGQ
jgi:hypothetical protein